MTKPTRRSNLGDPYVRTSLVPKFSIDRETFGALSERFARYMGTSTFIVQMSVFIIAWLAWNALAPGEWRFDPYTFTFLTLLLSLQASYAAPLILLAQNRQDDRDRISMEEDRARAAQTKADTEYLARELAAMRLKIGEVATRDYLRTEVDRLRDEIGELTAALRAAAPDSVPAIEAGSSKPKKKAKHPKASDLPGPTD